MQSNKSNVTTQIQTNSWKQSHAFQTTDSDTQTSEQPNDIINSIAFSGCGEHVAVGDKGGRVWIYSTSTGRQYSRPGKHYKKIKPEKESPINTNSYEFYGQFQSHEPEFDYLKSLDIEEKINDIQWLPRTNNSLHLLATNDKTIKLWKIFEKHASQPSFRAIDKVTSNDGLHCPKMKELETITAAVPRRIFANEHAYHIHSVSLSSDYELFLSSDDLRLNLWHVESQPNKNCYQLVDLKPEDMSDLAEVITCARFHPRQGNILSYSSSKGFTYLCDLRTNAKCKKPNKEFGVVVDSKEKSFFTEILVSVADMQFVKEGQYLLTRDFLTTKIWDLRMEKGPAKIIDLHPKINEKLPELYENDCIFDKFNICSSSISQTIVSGSYNNEFSIVNWEKNEIETLCLNNETEQTPSDTIQYKNKILHCAWHPNEETFAVATGATMYMYDKEKKSGKNNL